MTLKCYRDMSKDVEPCFNQFASRSNFYSVLSHPKPAASSGARRQ